MRCSNLLIKSFRSKKSQNAPIYGIIVIEGILFTEWAWSSQYQRDLPSLSLRIAIVIRAWSNYIAARRILPSWALKPSYSKASTVACQQRSIWLQAGNYTLGWVRTLTSRPGRIVAWAWWAGQCCRYVMQPSKCSWQDLSRTPCLSAWALWNSTSSSFSCERHDLARPKLYIILGLRFRDFPAHTRWYEIIPG